MSQLLLQDQLYQKSNKRNQCLKINHDRTTVDNNSINFHYTEDDYDKAIQAYIGSDLSKFLLVLFTLPIENFKIDHFLSV